MRYSSLDHFKRDGRAVLAKGPVALIFAEDDAALEPTLRYHLELGFGAVVMIGAREIELDAACEALIHRVDHAALGREETARVINAITAIAPGIWFYYGYNAEFLHYPFCETRSVGEMLTFHTEERRDAMLTYVVDLYAADLGTHPDGVDLEAPQMDRSGYYALARVGEDGTAKDRQYDFFGGLRWRFEEHIPADRRRIDRIALFKAKPGLTLLPDHRFNIEEYNTYACPWHHNITASIASFRTAKALKMNAGSSFDIPTFTWHNSVTFEWKSQQLLDLGLMEPGQWF